MSEYKLGAEYTTGVTPALAWQREKPTQTGRYLYKADLDWTVVTAYAGKGNFNLRQNPNELYWGLVRVADLDDGWWYGPVPGVPLPPGVKVEI